MTAPREAILAFIERELETHRYRDYGPIGLQVSGAEQVSKIACAVSSSSEVFELATAEGADLLLVHHGLFWDKDSRVIGPLMRRRLELLFRANISLAAYHLPLDGHQTLGNNALLADGLRLRDRRWFADHGGVPLAVIGTLAAPVPLQLLAELVTELCGRTPFAFTGGPEHVRSVAICSGRPSSLLGEAAALGADCVLTGEPQEDFRALAQELEISVLTAGHHATETFGVRALGAELERQFGLPWSFVAAPTGL